MADKTFNLITQLSLNDEQFKNSINNVKANIKDLVNGVEGATGNLGEMRKALMTLKNISFAGKTVEEIGAINKQIGNLMDEMGDLKASQKAMGTEFGSVLAKGLQGITAIGEVATAAASLFGASKESAAKFQAAMVQLIGVSQAFAVIQSLIEERTLQILLLKTRESVAMAIESAAEWANSVSITANAAAERARAVVTNGATIATRAAAVAQWLWNAALAANPIMLVILAIGLFVSAVVLLGKTISNNNAELKAQAVIMETINSVRGKATESITKEKVGLELLLDIAQDENKSKQERQKAINELNKTYPEYNKNLTTENINSEAVRKTTDLLTTAMYKNALAMAAREEIIRLTIEHEKAMASGEAGKLTFWQYLGNAIKSAGNSSIMGMYNFESSVKNATGAQEDFNTQLKTLNKIFEDNFSFLDETGKKVKDATGAYEILNKSITDQEEAIQNTIATGGVVTPDMLKKLNDAKKLLQDVNAQIKALYLANSGGAIKPILSPSVSQFAPAISAPNKLVHNESIEAANKALIIYNREIEKSLKKQIDFEKKQEQIRETAKQVGQAFQSSFETFGNSLVDSLKLADHGMQGFLKTMLQVIVKIISMLLANAISNAIVAATSSAASTGPAAVFTLPVFIGTAVAGVLAAFAAIPKFASGGYVPGSSYGGDRVPIMANSGELILNRNQQSNLFSMLNGSMGGREVQFKIRGTELVGVLNNHSRKINQIG